MPYAGRPGLPPAVAAFVADGRIRRGDAILDVGCGTGTDALTLASWGFRRVRRNFRLTPGVTTQLAEHAGGRGPPYARVALWLGTPRLARTA